ncbi:MAG TPA: VOC family protein [Rubricoccaceae bacterium]|nr:VOC family protein [Rubricoccaceae bacterium]
MASLPSLPRLDTPMDLAERALRKPSSTIWLHHVCVVTRHFDAALAFYVGTLGLTLRTVEAHPVFPSRLRARLVDAEGRDVLELLEAGTDAAPDAPHRVDQLGFCLPLRSWQVLRARLDAQEVPYQLTAGCLFLEDADGIRLRVEPLGSC